MLSGVPDTPGNRMRNLLGFMRTLVKMTAAGAGLRRESFQSMHKALGPILTAKQKAAAATKIIAIINHLG